MPEKRQKQSPVLKPHRSLLNVHNLQPSGFMESSGPYLFARQTVSGRDSEASRPPQSAGVRDPSVSGDRGGGHPKACGLREKENPLPVNWLTFPSQSELHPLPPACPPSSLPP